MPREKDKNGRFKDAIARQYVSVRLLPEIAEPLAKLPNRSKYIETVLLEKVAIAGIPDPDWEYIEEWEQILDLLIYAGSALIKIQQCEEKCEEGDNLIELLEKNIENWLKEKER